MCLSPESPQVRQYRHTRGQTHLQRSVRPADSRECRRELLQSPEPKAGN